MIAVMSAGELVPIQPLVALQHTLVPTGNVELARRVDELLARSKADATLRAYHSDWSDFVTWCFGVPGKRPARRPMPASGDTVAAYIADLATANDGRPARAVATIERRLSAIGYFHAGNDQANPAVDAVVRDTLQGIRRDLGVAPRRKTALSTEDLCAAVVALGSGPLDVRDRAILLVGFAGGFRRGELVALQAGDLEDHPKGILIRLRSKTDQEGAGRAIQIAYGEDPATCPVRAARRWSSLVAAEGPLGGHSLRQGMATMAASNGATDRTIMGTTGHTSADTLRSYIEEGTRFANPASGYLGL